MPDVFISYSRQDREFVRGLHEALLGAGRTDWVDWQDIPPTAEWWREVLQAIQASDTFVFVITPPAVASETCRQELAEATKLNKRIVPLLRHETGRAALPDPLPRLNWIPCTERDDFAAAIRLFFTALDQDLDWVKAHTRLLLRAAEWEGHARDNSFTLRGADLERAERWLAAGPEKLPAPTALQTEFVLGSRRAQAQRQRALLTGVSVALVLTLALAAIASFQRRQAVSRRFVSIAQYLAASAERELQQGRQDERAALLARQAYLFNERYGGERLAQIDAALRLVLSAEHQAVELGPVPGDGDLTAIAYSRTGRWLAAADDREHVRVWDMLHPRSAPRVLPHRSGAISALAFSPSADLLVGAAEDNLRWWHLEAGGEIPATRLGQSGERATALAFDAQGGVLAAGTRDGRTYLVTLSDHRPSQVRPCCRAGGRVGGVAFQGGPAPRVVTGGGDGVVRIWEASTGRLLKALAPPREGAIEAVAVGANGQIAAGFAERVQTSSLFEAWDRGTEPESIREPGVVAVWDATGSGRRVLEGHETSIAALAFHGDGRLVSAGGADGTVRLWSLGAAPASTALQPRMSSATAVASNPAGSTVSVVDGRRRVVRVWDLRRPVGAAQLLLGHVGGVIGLAFDPKGEHLAAAGTDDGTVAFWNLTTGEEGFPFGARPAAATAVAFSPDGRLFATGSRVGEESGGVVRLWEVGDAPRPPRSLTAHASAVRTIDFDPTGQRLLSVGRSDRQLRLIDLAQPKAPSRLLEVALDELVAARFGGGGRYVAWIGNGPDVRLWDGDRPEVAPALLACDALALTALAVSPASPTLAVGGANGRVCLWDLQTSRRRTFASGDDVVTLALDRAGKLLAAGSPNGLVRVWDLDHLEWAPRVLDGLPSRVTALAFAPDAKRLAGACDTSGSPVRVWPMTSVLLAAVCSQSRPALDEEEWQRFVGPDVPREPTCPKS